MPQLDPLLRSDFSPLCSFDAQISEKHESNRFHVLQSGDDFWLRLEGHPDWLGVFDNPNGQLGAIARSGDARHFEFSLRRALLSRDWGRAISLADPRPGENGLWRVLWRERRAFLMRSDTREAVIFGSSHDWMRGAWIQPGAHFARQFKRDWTDKTSDARAMLLFLELDDDERRRFGLQWERGSWEEMRRVARVGLQIEHPGDDLHWSLSQPLYSTGPEGSHQRGGSNRAPRLARLWTRLLERNVPVFDRKIAVRFLSPRPFSFQSTFQNFPKLRVAVEAPSEHERLEARLELRDWLREHAPDLLGEWS